MTTSFSINVRTTDGNYPEDIIISDREGVLGTWRKPIVLTTIEFLSLFDKMAFIVEKLSAYRSARDVEDPAWHGFKLSIDFNDTFDEHDNDAMSLYFKHFRLETGYGARFSESKKSEQKERIAKWNRESTELYRKLLLETVAKP